jgi:colanic acid/amylovoran biosynthesis protein
VRILIDSCAYTCRNVGDLAMLTVAVGRLRQLWPAASIHVITSAPQIVRAHCGDVGTVPLSGRRLVLQDRLLGRVDRLLPAGIAARWGRVERRLRLRNRTLVELSLRLKHPLTGQGLTDAAAFLSAIDRADLLVVSGAGVLTDAFLENALGVLATLEMAAQRGIPMAMLGQGIGPLVGDELRARAADVLPRVGMIAVRERLNSVERLQSLGVSPDRIVVTGDDAIVLAMPTDDAAAAGRPMARRIGVNMRVAPYADVESGHLAIVRDVLRDASRTHAAELVPVPIAHRDRMDVVTLQDLLAGMPGGADGGTSLDTPQRVIGQVRDCRIVVAGSYHAGVFALAQGIPVVALAASRYYLDKMHGGWRRV